MISINEYEIFQFTKRGYTAKYPGFSIPSTLSTPSMEKIIKHLSAVVISRLSQKDKDADKFDGTKHNYDEKVSLQKE
ncbi:MAG: hypothetical protein R3250_13595 [Melioribacteraceae bacterium]|nr:hypothetical protein [Melioribacteraceae bacterium]